MLISRRRLLKWLTAAGAVVPLPSQQRALAAFLEGEQKDLSQDPLRPQFHLLPARNWMNDPNGPIYINGQYHMFFQYNPKAAVWGNMSWAHAVSPDMIHWKHLPVAFTMTPGGPDAAGCFSGSAIAVTEQGRQRVYMVYTGVVRNKEHETVRNEGFQESQCLA
jgi:beta-fructofuranosidase